MDTIQRGRHSKPDDDGPMIVDGEVIDNDDSGRSHDDGSVPISTLADADDVHRPRPSSPAENRLGKYTFFFGFFMLVMGGIFATICFTYPMQLEAFALGSVSGLVATFYVKHLIAPKLGLPYTLWKACLSGTLLVLALITFVVTLFSQQASEQPWGSGNRISSVLGDQRGPVSTPSPEIPYDQLPITTYGPGVTSTPPLPTVGPIETPAAPPPPVSARRPVVAPTPTRAPVVSPPAPRRTHPTSTSRHTTTKERTHRDAHRDESNDDSDRDSNNDSQRHHTEYTPNDEYSDGTDHTYYEDPVMPN